MNKISRNILIASALAVSVFSTAAFKGCDGKSGDSTVVPIVQAPIKQEDKRVTRRTTLGLTLQSSAVIPADVDAVADASFAKLAADARAAGYTENLEPALYTINVKQDCIPSSDGTPSIPVDALDYDGTIYDKYNSLGDETDPELIAKGIVHKKDGIGKITAAEQVVMRYNQQTRSDEPTNTYLICYGSPALMTETVRNGPEHIILFHNNRTRYVQTVNHGTSGIAHTLIAVVDTD